MKDLHNYTWAHYHQSLKLDDSLLAASLSAAGQMTAASINATAAGEMNKRSAREARRQRKWATEERKAQNEWNLEMWNRQNEKNVEFWNMQNEKNLENWNRENEYNSPTAMRDRAVAAGFSPLAAIGGQVSQAGSVDDAQMLSASTPEGASIGSSSLPHFENPAAGLPAAADSAARYFLDWLNLKNQTKETDAKVKNLGADTDYKSALALTENSLRSGKIEFLGTQIKVGNADADLKGAQKDAVIQSVVESKVKIQQMCQWMSESQARVDLVDYQRYCMSRKIDKEVMLLGQEILLRNQQALDLKLTRGDRRYLMKSQSWLNNSQTTGHDYSNLISRDYVESGQYRTDRINRGKILGNDTDTSYWRKKQSEGMTYSDFGYTVVRGLGQLNMLTSSVKDVLQGFFFLQQGKQISNSLKIQPPSSPNPQQAPYSEVYY